MINMKAVWLFGTLFVLCAVSVKAEPSSALKFLQTTPASLFDVGMDRLSMFLQEEIVKTYNAKLGAQIRKADAFFKNQENKIVIWIDLEPIFRSEIEVATAIREVGDFIKERFGIDPKQGAPISINKITVLGALFLDNAEKHRTEVERFAHDLNSITEIAVTAWYSTDGFSKNIVKGASPLIGKP
jgi:hypothetical protein